MILGYPTGGMVYRSKVTGSKVKNIMKATQFAPLLSAYHLVCTVLPNHIYKYWRHHSLVRLAKTTSRNNDLQAMFKL